MYLPKLRELTEALRSLFSAPYTTKFPKAPFTPVAQYRGFPKYHQEFCVGCGTCAQVCPTNAIEVIDDVARRIRTLRVNYASCAQCGQCEEKCITGKGIQISTEYSVSTPDLTAPEVFNAIEKEMVACEACGALFAAQDHLRFVKERLGAKAYANPNLLLFTQSQYAEIIPVGVKERLRREDLFKFLCQKCRHKIVVKDEF